VLPEDDANRQLADGFVLGVDHLLSRNIQVLPEVGGWIEVLDRFESDHIFGMNTYPGRFIVLLFDFDDDVSRIQTARNRVPEELRERVFILGVRTEPEKLKPDFGTFEKIGLALADDCRCERDGVWGHELLSHNADEVARLRQFVRPILFKM
jgi:hypothetical protein